MGSISNGGVLGGAGMPWPVILSTLVFALVSAWLVFARAWEPWPAFVVVNIAAAGMVVSFIAALLVVAGRENRAEVWRLIRQTFQDDLNQLLKYLWIRKRK